jgi:hypothetical protein
MEFPRRSTAAAAIARGFRTCQTSPSRINNPARGDDFNPDGRDSGGNVGVSILIFTSN